MGNYLSCTLLSASPGGARVLLPGGGGIKIFREPVTAADLMLEAPNCFLVSAASMRVGGRFQPLPADEELDLGGLYAMFPMRRRGSVVRTADVGSLFIAARRHGGKSTGMRVAPEDDVVGVAVEKEEEEMMMYRRLHKCISKKPSLATIQEESVFS